MVCNAGGALSVLLSLQNIDVKHDDFLRGVARRKNGLIYGPPDVKTRIVPSKTELALGRVVRGLFILKHNRVAQREIRASVPRRHEYLPVIHVVQVKRFPLAELG